MQTLRTFPHPKIPTKDSLSQLNGFLIPIYNLHEKWFSQGQEPQQVYLTVVAPNSIKGPHLHYIRRGCFTCIKGNIRIIAKVKGAYEIYYSGESHHYLSIEIPSGIPVAIQNIAPEEAFVLNMPYPAWTAEMHDEHTADFSDFDFSHYS